MVRLSLSGRGLADLDFWTKSDPFLTLSRPNRSGTGLVQLRKTETIMNNLNPDWKLLYIPLAELCDADLNMPLRIDVYDEDKSSRHDDHWLCPGEPGRVVFTCWGLLLPIPGQREGGAPQEEGGERQPDSQGVLNRP